MLKLLQNAVMMIVACAHAAVKVQLHQLQKLQQFLYHNHQGAALDSTEIAIQIVFLM